MPKSVEILSGVPGCGKSTFALQRLKFYANGNRPVYICSADDFHMVDGEYVFNPANIGQAHATCLRKFIKSLVSLADCDDCLVIVDNTNIHAWERMNYIAIAEALGFEVSVHCWLVHAIVDLHVCIERNTHGVPADVIARMALAHEVPSGAQYHEIGPENAQLRSALSPEVV